MTGDARFRPPRLEIVEALQSCIVLRRPKLARESEGAAIQQVTCNQRAGAGSCNALAPEG
jgi:hypothetical protein